MREGNVAQIANSISMICDLPSESHQAVLG
uniref:Uncharacterized protein n=1 Tax=Arundo donax TaxID=35708 RepID=A0A0A9APE0_ARUDO